MKKVIHKADTRGHSKYEWLDSYHTFSFDEYFDSNRINFGALRVLNDDKVAPGEGFQTHPHKNMEIVSIPLKGHLQHGDSKKNSRIITDNECRNRYLPQRNECKSRRTGRISPDLDYAERTEHTPCLSGLQYQ